MSCIQKQLNKMSFYVHFYAMWGAYGFLFSKYFLYIKYNFMRKNTQRSKRAQSVFFPLRDASVSIHKTAKIEMTGRLIIGESRNKASRMGSDFLLEKEAYLRVSGDSAISHGCDIQVFPKGVLKLDGMYANAGLRVSCAEEIFIGQGTVIGKEVIIRDTNGHTIVNDSKPLTQPVSIGKHVWVGDRATILKGVTIGEGAIIASGTVVVKDVPPRSLCAGVPGKIIKNNVEWY